MKRISILLLLGFIVSCSPRLSKTQRQIQEQITVSQVFKNNFTGLFVYNPMTKDTLVNINGNRFFTPASNTKIFTLYSSLKLIPERIEALKYTTLEDTIYIKGTADPGLFHPFFKDSTIYHFLKDKEHIKLLKGQLEDDHFGPGWAWEDYDAAFSPERSALPIYGNVLEVRTVDGKASFKPEYFVNSSQMTAFSMPKKRDNYSNEFYVPLVKNDTLHIPFIQSDSLTAHLLSLELNKKIGLSEDQSIEFDQLLSGIERDSILKQMMVVSDNFLAEQLLLNASNNHYNRLNSYDIRRYVIDTLLTDLQQKPRWVDGSGLSRYNLFSPISMVQVLEKIQKESPNYLEFFPVGGETGTLEHWFNGTDRPYIYAKTGSLGNNFNLSGYLITNSGTTLIFSFMNNHYTKPTSVVKKEMGEVLRLIRDHY